MKRMTRQRKALLSCLETARRPLGVNELVALAAKEIPGINLSTVYRNLKILLDERRVALVKLPGGDFRYEMVTPQHHHHFLCDGCGRAFAIAGCLTGLAKLVPKGFKLSGHSLTLNGLCLECYSSPT